MNPIRERLKIHKSEMIMDKFSGRDTVPRRTVLGFGIGAFGCLLSRCAHKSSETSGDVAAANPRGTDCALTEHLKGFLPADANAAISTTGQFHHFHFVHIPKSILVNPPTGGWTTISSMMSPELGIDDFFFRAAQAHKQFHCHQIDISRTQLKDIAVGKEATVVAFINGQPNHKFVFNVGGGDPVVAFDKERQRIIDLAIAKNLKMTGTRCTTQTHSGVTVFSRNSSRVVTNLTELENLKGY
jgi:hypothetical protein